MASHRRIDISEVAEQDIRESAAWIAKEDPAAALSFFDGILESIDGIPAFPGVFPIAPETKLGFTDAAVHQLLFGKRTKYRISSPKTRESLPSSACSLTGEKLTFSRVFQPRAWASVDPGN
jgi:plasmid stabilization system protein ParE